MKTFSLKHSLLTLLFIVSCCQFSFSQEFKTSQDPKFNELLKVKQGMNSSSSVENTYKIQLYYGDSDSAKKELLNFKKDFKEIDVTMVYTNPTYKVWAGNYKLRIYAEKALLEIKKKYPTAFILKPNN